MAFLNINSKQFGIVPEFSRCAMKNPKNPYNNDPKSEDEWATKILAELSIKLNRFLKYLCCFPIKGPSNFYAVNTIKRKKNITFKEPHTTVIDEETSPQVFTVTEAPALGTDLPNARLRVRTKEKLKNFFRKLKKEQVETDSVKSTPNEKSCGERVPIHADRSLELESVYSSSNDSFPGVFGDGPQKRGRARRRVAGFFNDIYNFRHH